MPPAYSPQLATASRLRRPGAPGPAATRSLPSPFVLEPVPPVAMPHIIDTGLKPGCNCRGGLPRWPARWYSERGGRSAVARRRKKNESDEGPGHAHLKMAALAGRLTPTREEEEEEERE